MRSYVVCDSNQSVVSLKWTVVLYYLRISRENNREGGLGKLLIALWGIAHNHAMKTYLKAACIIIHEKERCFVVVALWTLAEPWCLAASIKDCMGWSIWVWIWEPDIKQTAIHDILFSWAALTQILLHLLFSYASKSCTRNVGILRADVSRRLVFNLNNLQIVL